MKLALVTLLFPILAFAKGLTKENVAAFLKSEDCEFGAYRVYVGKDLPGMKSGTINSRGICAATYIGKGASKSASCFVQVVDFETGRYFGEGPPGVIRRANSECSLKTLERLYQKGSYLRTESLVDTKKWRWEVGSDIHGFGSHFVEVTKSK